METIQTHGLVTALLELPDFHAEWVLWLLLGLSLLAIGVMIERAIFHRQHKVQIHSISTKLSELLAKGDFDGAASLLKQTDSLETNVVLFGLSE